MLKTIDVSVVIPLYNEEENVQILYQAVKEALIKLDKECEIIFVDDGSQDATFSILKSIIKKESGRIHARLVKFRANFGQSAATDAGFELASGEVIVVMDGDLQNDPRDIGKVLAKISEGYDVVSGWRKNRKDKLLLRKVPSRIANRLICSVTNVTLHDTGCALKAYRKDVVKKINLYGELHRFLPALAKVEGARITEIPVNHHARKFGKSKYGISRTFKVLMDLLSLNLFIRHLQRPLHFFGLLGFLFLIGGLICTLACAQGLYRNVYGSSELNVMISVTFLFLASSLQFLCLGLIASLIFQTGKKKSVYLLLETEKNKMVLR